MSPVSNLVEVGKLVDSTSTALMQLTDMWIQAAERKELSGVCMIDQSAAYDLLDHTIFLEKLQVVYNFYRSII